MLFFLFNFISLLGLVWCNESSKLFDSASFSQTQLTQAIHEAALAKPTESSLVSLLTLASDRKTYLSSLYLSSPSQALILSDDFYNSIVNITDSNNNSTLSSYISKLKSSGVIENYFHNEKLDIAHVCGLSYPDAEKLSSSSVGFCSESVYVHSHAHSYAVAQPANYPLQNKKTHYSQYISGYILDDRIVLHHPNNVNNNNFYNKKYGHNIKLAAIDPDLPTTRTSAISMPLTGASSILFVSIEFTDASTWSIQSDSDFANVVSSINNRYVEASFGKFSFATSKLITVRLANDVASYGDQYWKMSSEAEALAIGILGSSTYWGYKSVVWQWKGLKVFGWAGLGASGARGVWNNGYFGNGGSLLMAHELGHNFGLAHAGSWSVKDGNPLSVTGSLVEYGDGFDVMGNAWEPSHYNAFYKVALNWLDPAVVVSACGLSCASLTQQIWPYDQFNSQSQISLVHVKHDYSNDYLGEYTLQTGTGGVSPNGRWARSRMGLMVRALKYEWQIFRSILINANARTTDDIYYSALQQGESLNDCQQGIFITNGGYDKCGGQNFNCVSAIVNRIPVPSTSASFLPSTFYIQDIVSGQYLSVSSTKTLVLTAASTSAIEFTSVNSSSVFNNAKGALQLLDKNSGFAIRHSSFVLYDRDPFVSNNLDYSWLFRSTGKKDQYYIMNYYGQPAKSYYVDLVSGQAKITDSATKRVWKIIAAPSKTPIAGPSWSQITSNALLGSRRRFGMITASNNNIIVFGGLLNGVSQNDVLQSTSASNYATWTKLGNAAWSPRNYFAFGKLSNQQVLLVGGGSNENSGVNNEVWISSATNYASWSLVTNGPFSARLSASSVVIGNTFYLFSGTDSLGAAAFADMWSTSNNGVTWTQINSALPNARYFSSLSYVSNTMVVVGGSNFGNTLSDIWLSSDLGLTWSQQTTATIGPIRSYSTVTYNNVLYIAGGYNFQQGGLGAIYSSTNGKNWVAVNSAPGFFGHFEGSIAVANGKLIKVAGSSDSTVWSSDLLNLGANTWKQTNILNINVTYSPTSINVNDVVTFSATANDVALISFNFVDETFQNAFQNIVGPTVENKFTSSGFKKVVVQATNMKGKVSKFIFSVKVGSVSGTAPSYSSLGYKTTCSTNNINTYDSYVNGVPTNANNLQQ